MGFSRTVGVGLIKWCCIIHCWFLSHHLNIKKSYQRVRPGKLADNNLLEDSTSLTPAVLSDYIQQSRQSPAELQEERGVWGGFCCVSLGREMKRGLKMMVCLISALCPAERRAGVLLCCPEGCKIQPALAHYVKNTALDAGCLPLPMGAVTDGAFLQGNFIKRTFYCFAFRALILRELALLLRPSDVQTVFFSQWNGFQRRSIVLQIFEALPTWFTIMVSLFS